jgi:L-seryl-tRNA(Ser) seleniumtransferase
LPVDRLPSHALTFAPLDGRGATLEGLAQQWRSLPQPVIGRINDGKLWLDLRCLEQEGALVEALSA